MRQPAIDVELVASGSGECEHLAGPLKHESDRP